MANTRTTTVPIEGAIAAFYSEVKLGPCTSVLRIVLQDIIINTVYIASLYTIFRIARQGTFILHAGIHTGGGKTWDIPPNFPPPPQNPFSIDIIWHNYNKIHNKIRLFFCLKMSSISLKSTLLMLGPSIAIFIKCSKFECERQLRRRVFMSFI